MKRSLIVGFVLVATLLLTSFVIPTVANEGNGMDEQTTTTHHLADTVSTAEIMRVNKSDSPKIKENDIAYDDIKEENMDKETSITYYTEGDITMLAQLLYNECRGIESVTEKACVVWTVLNRVDISSGVTIAAVVTAENQFAYSDAPLWDELLWIAEDVLSRWNAELNGETSVGRVLPADYKWFGGDGEHNYFRNAYDGNYDIWDYSLPSPYES